MNIRPLKPGERAAYSAAALMKRAVYDVVREQEE